MNNQILSKSAIKEFKEIYKKIFGIELSEKEAERKATKLLSLYKAVYS